MKKTVLAVILVAASLIAVAPTGAQTMDVCPHAATIAALHECVQHAEEQGFIDNPGIAGALHAKLDAAEAAANRNQPAVAVNIVQSFIRQLNAQSGKHIVAEHATHLQMHAEMVIDALTP